MKTEKKSKESEHISEETEKNAMETEQISMAEERGQDEKFSV